MPQTIAEQFWGHVDERGPMLSPYLGPCWLWLLALTPKGYGRPRIAGRNIFAHRFAYELLAGPIPKGMTLDHLCRNRACVNPAHLEAVTNRVNVLRGTGITAANLTKTHCPQGHPYDEANTCIRPNGKRRCRRCEAERMRRVRARGR